jgi:caffeoyl-CoA O-methyltransferase
MKNRPRWTRRELLEAGGGAFGLYAMAANVPKSSAAEKKDEPASSGRDPARMKRLLEEMDSKGQKFWSVPRKDGEFLHLLVKATRARRVLEIGTSQGYSAIWIGFALEETGGRLNSIESDRERAELARKNLSEAGLSSLVNVIRGDAHAEVAKLGGPFDFVFLDADKEGQVDYFRKLYPKKLAPGAVLLAHNAIRQASSMKDYLDMIQKQEDFDTVILSVTMDDGFCLSYRHRK